MVTKKKLFDGDVGRTLTQLRVESENEPMQNSAGLTRVITYAAKTFQACFKNLSQVQLATPLVVRASI